LFGEGRQFSGRNVEEYESSQGQVGSRYLNGDWIGFSSTNVNRAKYEPNFGFPSGKQLPTGTVQIEFVSGALYEYQDIPESDFLDLVLSSSKGRYTYFHVRGKGPSRKGMSVAPWDNFRMIHGPTRSKSKIRDIMRARRPQVARHHLRYYFGRKNGRPGRTGDTYGGNPTVSIH
jgi:hypothetical protein